MQNSVVMMQNPPAASQTLVVMMLGLVGNDAIPVAAAQIARAVPQTERRARHLPGALMGGPGAAGHLHLRALRAESCACRKPYAVKERRNAGLSRSSFNRAATFSTISRESVS